MTSFNKIADQLETDGDAMVAVEEEEVVVTKGENKVPGSRSRSSKRKHKLSSKNVSASPTKGHAMKKRKMAEGKSKPRYFCEF